MTAPFYVSYAALWALVAFQTLILLGLVREYARRTEPPTLTDALPFDDHLRGQPVPEFSALDVSGAPVDESSLIGQRTALLFVSPDCPTCSATLDELEALERKSKGRVLIVCRATDEDCRNLSLMYGFDATVVVDADGAISTSFGVNGMPTAVIVSETGEVETYGHPMRSTELEELFLSEGVRA
jgi:peroxiredoxin